MPGDLAHPSSCRCPLPHPVPSWVTKQIEFMGGLRARLYQSGQGHAFHAHPSCHDVRAPSVVRLDSMTGIPRWSLPFASDLCSPGCNLFCLFLSLGPSHILIGKQVLCSSPVARRPSLKSLNSGLRHIYMMIYPHKTCFKYQPSILLSLLEAAVISFQLQLFSKAILS